MLLEMLLEISTHGSSIKRDHESFVIKSDGKTHDVPAEKVSAIFVTANAVISTQAIKLAMERQIQVVLADWAGRPFARMWASSQGKASGLRRWQYLNQDTDVGMSLAADITQKKIRRQKAALTKLRSNRVTSPLEVNSALQSIDKLLTKKSSPTKDVLLGIEGMAAREYFTAISVLLPKEWQFKSRSQHPALDGFNAVLNYMYGIAYSDVEKIIILSGLDPNAGFYHADSYGKPTLSYDLIELSRPIVDRSAVALFTKRLARKSWFEEQDGSVFLTKTGRGVVISKYVDSCKKYIERETWDYCRKIIGLYGESI